MDYSLALQWTLNETADKFLKVGKDLMRMATEDRVQPIALLASEQFGTTLAICPITRSKIHALVNTNSNSVFVGFLKAKVGFATGNSLTYLAKSMAGVNFLALAAALVSTMNNFEAGTALEKMIMATAADKTIIPDAHHIRDLLDVLEPRLNGAGFMNDVIGWKLWWMEKNQISETLKAGFHRQYETVPSSDGMHGIVSALREVCRIGEADRVTFTAGIGAPWLTAFVKWCLGIPPAIYHQDGRLLLEQLDSPVTIIFSEDETFRSEICIRITSTFSSFSKIIHASLVDDQSQKKHIAAGMINIQLHAKHTLMTQELDVGLGYRALLHALPYALKMARDRFGQDNFHRDDPRVATKASPCNAFANETIIANVMAVYLSLEERRGLKDLPEGSLLEDQPTIRLWLEHEKSTDSTSTYGFMAKLSAMVADILVLSLFHGCLDSLLVYHEPNRDWTRVPNFATGIFNIVTASGELVSAGRTDILVWALNLVNHDVATVIWGDSWIGSSFRGQVVFPKIFEAQSLSRTSYLELSCISGVLLTGRRNTKQFSMVTAPEGTIPSIQSPYSVTNEIAQTHINRSLGMYSKAHLFWNMSELGDRLTVGMKWDSSIGERNPVDVLEGLAHAWFLDSCPHQPKMSRSAPFQDSKRISSEAFTYFSESVVQPYGEIDNIKIYPVEDNEGLRMIALSSIVFHHRMSSGFPRIVINKNACLDCLLDQCCLIGTPFLIL